VACAQAYWSALFPLCTGAVASQVFLASAGAAGSNYFAFASRFFLGSASYFGATLVANTVRWQPRRCPTVLTPLRRTRRCWASFSVAASSARWTSGTP
jgi:hypothetical protein